MPKLKSHIQTVREQVVWQLLGKGRQDIAGPRKAGETLVCRHAQAQGQDALMAAQPVRVLGHPSAILSARILVSHRFGETFPLLFIADMS